MQLTAALTAYKLACQAENVSEHTWRWYEQKLKAFLDWVKEQDISEVEDIRTTHAQAFTVRIKSTVNRYGKPISDYTVHGYVQVIKGFLNWAVGEDLIEERVVKKIAMPKREQKLIQVLSNEQISLLYNSCDSAKARWIAARDRAILAVMLDTGIRANELCTLTRDRCCLNSEAQYLIINGKGRKQREVGLGKKAAYGLHLYITRYRPKSSHDYIFSSHKYPDQPLTPKGLDSLLYRLRDRVGAEHFTGIRLSAHTMRHTHSYNYLKASGDVLRLSRLLGHTSVQVTENYIRCFGSQDARGVLSVFDVAMRRA
jgi:integrase/recombinase XerD